VALAWTRWGGGGGAGDRPIGGVTACQSRPRFTAGLGLGARAALGTSVEGLKGLAVLDPEAGAAGRPPVYQHATWDDAGYLGPWVYDRVGNIYVAPVPLVSLEENPPERQNKVYRVDTDTQVMAEYVDLPAAQPPSGANPFGVIGLAYDCDTDSLYATSVAGSTATEEVGRVFRVDLATGTVAARRDGVDAFGAAVFNGARGKRLYYGLARAPELYSIGLDERGDFAGEPRLELSLAALQSGTGDKIRRVRFGAGPAMTLHAYDFTYSLQVASERQERLFTFAYDAAGDTWSFQADAPGGGPLLTAPPAR